MTKSPATPVTVKILILRTGPIGEADINYLSGGEVILSGTGEICRENTSIGVRVQIPLFHVSNMGEFTLTYLKPFSAGPGVFYPQAGPKHI